MTPAPDILQLGIVELGSMIESRALSPTEVVDACLSRIEEAEPSVGAFSEVLAEGARAAARRAEAEIGGGEYRGPLHGVPVVLKDLIETAGVRTAAGSRVLADHVPVHSATVAERLASAGAILLGKATTDEFAMSVYTEPTRNPWALDRIPGGSSGGSAAALAARMCPGALGTDTAGSIRIPSALCGVTGLKPTYGRVSRAGVIPFSWSFDHVGPMARSADDVAVLLQAIAGHDRRDATSASVPVPDFRRAPGSSLAGLRIGVPAEHFFDRVAADAARLALEALDVLVGLGAELVEVTLPHVSLSAMIGDLISLPEASAAHRGWLRERPGEYRSTTRDILHIGDSVLAVDYVQAQRLRVKVLEEFTAALYIADVIAAPTTPLSAIEVGQTQVAVDGETTESALDAFCRLTYPANVTGLPAISIPCGLDSLGLPLGLQLIGRPFEEAIPIRMGSSYQEMTEWHTRMPAATNI